MNLVFQASLWDTGAAQGGGGWGGGGGFPGAGGGGGGAYQGGMQGSWQSQGPGGGQRRTKVKQRGRENVQGMAAPSRQTASEAARYSLVRLKVAGLRTHERSQKREAAQLRAEQIAAPGGAPGETATGRKSKKRKSDVDADGKGSKESAKRKKSSAAAAPAAALGGLLGEEEEDAAAGIHQIKHALSRASDPEGNRFEVNSWVEVFVCLRPPTHFSHMSPPTFPISHL